jgi:hypothetical protein
MKVRRNNSIPTAKIDLYSIDPVARSPDPAAAIYEVMVCIPMSGLKLSCG